ncbi:hypothetical protein K493DRAFT_309533 [Basidiobolus meristosporus CBS 931.73]|uniref:Uncharacterized protein n=1 Tax=Basidiobolus meristosporus CBS 931.73 TaxID=1314790 RepID=A0A1Y1VU96_9FUNG|nr:hypothetical protein K493DRAFT_309533 [Basidiobolus meristosporus CBS 931.73]|eukprot:ORX64586.1 hypothetical protein K493DRAFT_309533 [Basidiobolus meristosporus CBS 931.73]
MDFQLGKKSYLRTSSGSQSTLHLEQGQSSHQHGQCVNPRKRTRRGKKHSRAKKNRRVALNGEVRILGMRQVMETSVATQKGQQEKSTQPGLKGGDTCRVGMVREYLGENQDPGNDFGDLDVDVMSSEYSTDRGSIGGILEENIARATIPVASNGDCSNGLSNCCTTPGEERSTEKLHGLPHTARGTRGRREQFVSNENINVVIEDLILEQNEVQRTEGRVSIAEIERAARSIILPTLAHSDESNSAVEAETTSGLVGGALSLNKVSAGGSGYFSTKGALDLDQAAQLGGLLQHYNTPMNESESALINIMRAEFMNFWLEKFYQEPEKMSRISHGNRGLKGLLCTQANVYWNSTIKQFILFSMRLCQPDIRSPQAYWAVVGVKANVDSYLMLRKGRHGSAPLSASTLNNIFHHLMKAVYLYNICYNPKTKDKPHVRCDVEMHLRALGSVAGRLKNQHTFERRQKRVTECTREEEAPTTQEVGFLFSRLLESMQAILETVLPRGELNYEVVQNKNYTKQQQYSLGKWSFVTTPMEKLIAHLKESLRCEQAYRLLQQLTIRYQQLLYAAIRISAPCRRCKPFAHMLLHSSQRHADKDSRYSGEQNILYDPKQERFHLELVEDKRPGGRGVTLPLELTKFVIFWISMLRPVLVVCQSHPYFFSRPNGRDGLDPQRTGHLFQGAIRQVYTNSNRTFDQQDLQRWCSSYGISSGLVDEICGGYEPSPFDSTSNLCSTDSRVTG